MRRRWLVVAIAALLLTPAGAVLAQNDTTETNETDEEGADEGFDANESANASDPDEADDEGDDEEESDDEADEDDEADDEESEAQARGFQDDGERSDWEEDNGTYTGEFLQVTVDEKLPGLRDVTYLQHDATVFASVQMAGENLSYHAQRDVLAGETGEHEFAAIDDDGGQLNVEGDEDVELTIEVADGVDVNASDRYSDDDTTAYQLHLDGNASVWFVGEQTSYANGTFTVTDDARLADTFPPAEDRDEREDERSEREDEREDREDREAGSQWDRSNGSFAGDHVSFTLDANETRILDYALNGSTIPVFAEADIAEDSEAEWRAHGKHFELRTDDERVRVLDIPPAVLEIRAGDDTNATLVLADGVNASLVEDDDEDHEVYELELAQNRTGWVSGDELTLDNGTFTVGDRAHFRTLPMDPDASENKGPGSMPDAARDERGPPEDRGPDEEPEGEDEDDERGPPDEARAHPLDEQTRSKVEQAKAAGQVGAEVHVGDDSSEPVAVEMGDVRVTRTWTATDNETRAGMQIEAPDDAPATTVTMNLDEAALENVTITEAPQKLAVSYDNESIEMADDLDDVLDPTDDEGEPEYLLLVGGSEVQVLVSVPHFSPHTIEVYETQSGEQVDSSNVPGFGAVSLALASGLAALVAGTRRQN